MVAKIITGKSIIGALNYNEHKVQKGKAELLLASLYPKAEEQLNFYEKLARLENLASLNQATKTNCLHISLNFDPSENLDKEQLKQIAETYMQRIGFGEQPFLVYQHHDAGHSHVHIVSTNIQKNGNRIVLHNIGKTLSEPARKEIEKEFNLIPAESKSQRQLKSLKPILLEKAVYGKSETKRAITNIVGQVVRSYKFTSLSELNAVLRQFNVMADQGKDGTKMRQHGGLHYSIINNNGNPIGVPIKASAIYERPTLKNIEARFEQNEKARKEFKEGTKEIISDVRCSLKGAGKEQFMQTLKQKGINAVFHQNASGFVYGLTYIDNVKRCVFKGSDLGKEFSAKAITEHLGEKQATSQSMIYSEKPTHEPKAGIQKEKEEDIIQYGENPTGHNQASYLPYELSKDKKKKKKRRTL